MQYAVTHTEPFAAILRTTQQTYLGMKLRKFLDDRGCVIRRPIVDDQNFGVPATIPNAAQNFIERFSDAGAFVISRNNYTEVRSIQRGSQSTFLQPDTLIRVKFYATLLQPAASVGRYGFNRT